MNLAVSLKNKGHRVIIYTPHHDPKHCFAETIDGTIPVEVAGRAFPRTIFGKGLAFCSLIRMWLCTLYLICFGFRFDLVIVDQVNTKFFIHQIQIDFLALKNIFSDCNLSGKCCSSPLEVFQQKMLVLLPFPR